MSAAITGITEGFPAQNAPAITIASGKTNPARDNAGHRPQVCSVARSTCH
jgi:hypothetical protein